MGLPCAQGKTDKQKAKEHKQTSMKEVFRLCSQARPGELQSSPHIWICQSYAHARRNLPKPHLTYQVKDPKNSEDHRTRSKVQISETFESLEPGSFNRILAKESKRTWNPTAGQGLCNPAPQSRKTARNRCACFSIVTDED